MKLLRATGVLLLSTFALTGCDESTGVELADLAGAWVATQFEYEEIGGAGFVIDAISTAGGTVTLDVQESGSFAGTIRVPGLTHHPQTGEVITVNIGGTIDLIDDENLSIDFDQATEMLGLFGDFDASFELDGDVLTFVNDDTEFDFPDAQEQQLLGQARGEVPSTLTVTLTR